MLGHALLKGSLSGLCSASNTDDNLCNLNNVFHTDAASGAATLTAAAAVMEPLAIETQACSDAGVREDDSGGQGVKSKQKNPFFAGWGHRA